jgi:hypothetical protein
MKLPELEPEEVSLAFLCLVGKESMQNLPPQLQELDPKQWEYLAHLLVMLETEQSLSSVQ